MPELHLERLKLQDLIQDTVSLYHNSQRHTIDWDGTGDPIFIMADAKLFVRIFGNIILNAFQSGDESALTVQIRIVVKDKLATISFADNGKGMTPEVVDKVFIPYFSTKETGSGLGLAIAKQGIEQAGGRIWCESKQEIGSTFFISLPIV
jgi:two-component system, NtrC family, nitrogen regulation sensor histidine kinase NtrY